jgi:uncharacterized protein YndB with AHSA1/START domain
MTKDRDFKRLVRARMEKTGESYAAARASLLAKVAPPLPDDYEKIAGMTDAAVEKATGKAWPEWVAILDRAGAASWEHRAMSEHLHGPLAVPNWWTQMIAVGYERLRGLRATGQRRDGSYEVSKTRTLAVPVSVAWKSFSEKRTRNRWLRDLELTITTSTKPKSMRIRLGDGSRLDAYFTSKSSAKCAVTLQHRALPDAETKERMRAFWTERLEALRAMLETP